jgi:hypothetical protein
LNASPAEGDPVSVVWGEGSRHVIRRAKIVTIPNIGGGQKFFHYRLCCNLPRPTTYNDGMETIESEGSRWVRGWEGPQVDALGTVAALSEPT